MNYPLKMVLWVRRNAEDKALHLLNVARAEEKKAEEELRKRESEWKEYQRWLVVEEARLLDGVIGQPVTNRELMARLEQIRWNAAQEPRYEKRVEEARSTWKVRQGETATATKAYQAAAREVMKLQEHEKEWRIQEKVLVENREEAEIEEASETLFNFRKGASA